MGNPCKGVILDTSLGIRGIWWLGLSQVLSRTCLHIARKILFPLRFKYEYFHPLISSLWLRWKQKNLCLFLNFLGCFLQFCKYWTLIVESSTALMPENWKRNVVYRHFMSSGIWHKVSLIMAICVSLESYSSQKSTQRFKI